MASRSTRPRGHAATRAGALDASGREALLRYVLRPPIAQDRIQQGQDGLVRILLERPFPDGTVAVELDPLSLLCRLAASVPPPRHHSTTPSTTAHPSEAAGPVRVTHPFHPLHGQELDVVAHRVQWGEARVFYRDPRGHRASMPAAWTSVAAPEPHIQVAGGRSRFRLQDLIELAAFLHGVRR